MGDRHGPGQGCGSLIRRTLIVLARSPVAGHGKTRLRRRFGDLVDDLTVTLAADTLGWAGEGPWDLLLVHHGPTGALLSEATLSPGRLRLDHQVDGDLGDRIDAGISAAFAGGASQVVLIGTDSPTLPSALVEAAFAELDGAEATLVPAVDGGWIALGVSRPLDRCLRGVTWSSATTAAETIVALECVGRRVVLLGPWYDVDEPEDLRRLAADLRGEGATRAPRTAELLCSSSPLASALEGTAA